jgi:hypothetical protein
MPKRGGLGQRGLDLLISASPGAGDKSAAEEKSASKEKSSEKKNSKTSGKSTVKAGTKNTSKSSTTAKSAGKSSTGKGSGKNAGTAKKGPKGNADENVKVSKARSRGVAETGNATNNTADANTTVTSSGDNIGGIVGTNYGATVIDCKNYADVTGHSSVGGIVGYTRDYHHKKDGYIVACTTYPEATIKATNGKAGGIAGGVMTDNGHENTYMHVVACTSFSKIEGATKGCIAGSISGKQHTAGCVAVKNGANVLYGSGTPTTESDVEDAILYDAAAVASQADVNALNAAIAHFNELNPPAEAYCNYTWTLENNFPVLKN